MLPPSQGYGGQEMLNAKTYLGKQPGTSLRLGWCGTGRGWTRIEHLGFLLGQPINQHVVGNGLLLDERFALVLWERGHLFLGAADEPPGLFRPVLPEEAHGAEKARGSLNVLVRARRLLSDSQSLVSVFVLAVAILSQPERKLIPRLHKTAFPEFDRPPRKVERLSAAGR